MAVSEILLESFEEQSVQKTIDATSAPSFTVDYSSSSVVRSCTDNNPFCVRRCHDSAAASVARHYAQL